MPIGEARKREVVARAAAAARRLAPQFREVMLTHFEDAETLAAVKPDEPEIDLDLQTRMNRAAAVELTRLGVAVALQTFDRDAYFAWLGERRNTPEMRAAFRDPGRILRGDAALRALGVTPQRPGRAPRRGSKEAGGTPAERLVRAWEDESPEGELAFLDLAEEVISSGRQGVLDMAVRRVAERLDADGVAEFASDLIGVAEMLGDEETWAELTALPLLLAEGAAPQPGVILEGIEACGMFPDGARPEFTPAFFRADDVASLAPVAVRRVLAAMLRGEMPADLRPLPGREVGDGNGLRVLLGVLRGSAMPEDEKGADLRDEANDNWEDDPGEDEEDEARQAAFAAWSQRVVERVPGLLGVLPPLPVSEFREALSDILDHLHEALGRVSASIDEVRDFVETALSEAGGAPVTCRVRAAEGGTELVLETREGRFLDSRTFPPGALPSSRDELAKLLEGVDLLPDQAEKPSDASPEHGMAPGRGA